MVENGEHGGSTAAPVARSVMDAYLLPRAGADPEILTASGEIP